MNGCFRKKTSILGFILLAFVYIGQASAQKSDKPNFSGTWTLDTRKSKDFPPKSRKEKAQPADSRLKESSVIIIEHLGAKLTTTEKQITETLDDKGAIIDK